MSTPEEVAFRLELRDRARFSAEARAASRDMEGMGRSADRAGRQARSSSTSWRALSSATRVGVYALAGVTTAAVAGGAALGVWGLKLYSLKEQAQIAFTTMLGSAQQAKVFIGQLQDFANKSPFEFQDTVTGAQRLLAMGFAAKEVLPTLTAVSDAAAGLGQGPETINRIVTALGQIKTKGILQAEEFRQLNEAGIPAWQFLADYLGKTIPQVMKLVTKRGVDSATALAAVTEGIQKKFGGLTAKQAMTLQGLTSTLHDVGQTAVAALITPFAPDIKRGLAGAIDILGDPGNQRAMQRFARTLRHDVGAGIAFIRHEWPYVRNAFNAARPTMIEIGNVAINVGRNLFKIGKVAAEVLGPPLLRLGTSLLPVVLKAFHGVDKIIGVIGQHKKEIKTFFQPLADALTIAAIATDALNVSLDVLGDKINTVTGPLQKVVDLYNKAHDLFPSFDFHGINISANPIDWIDPRRGGIAGGVVGVNPFQALHAAIGAVSGAYQPGAPVPASVGVPASGVIFTPSRQNQQGQGFTNPKKPQQPLHVHVHIGRKEVGKAFIQDIADENARGG